MAVQTIVTSVALVSPAGSTVAVLRAASVTVSLDEGTAPFATARVEVAMPTAAQFAMMKPGAGYFLSVTTYPSTNPESPLLLKITDRNRTTTGNVELQAASAELELQAFTPSAMNRSNWTNQTSVPAILSNVLTSTFGSRWARYLYGAGAFGEDIGTPPFRTYQSMTNLCTNSGFEYGVAPWTGVNANLTASTANKHSGIYSLAIAPSTMSDASRAELVQNLQPNTKYTLSAWILSTGVMTGTGATNGRYIYLAGSVGGVSSVLAQTPAAPNVANIWNRVSLTFTTPALLDAGTFSLRIRNGTSLMNAITMLVDDIMLTEGDGLETDGTLVPYFDGDTVDGTAGYNYDWQGAAGQTSSTRSSIIARDPEALTWSPGQSAWDFLQPILQSVGVRLWSDGYAVLNGAVVARMFWATNSFGLTLPAPVVSDGTNLFDLTQIDSWSAEFPDGTPMYADQVIIHYAWTDNLGIAREAYDVYPATGKKPYYLDKQDTPFAGVGRAQGIYNRISARATMYQGTTWFNKGIEVGRQLSIASAKAVGGSVVGYVDAVTYDPSRGTTEFRTKQTVAYTSSSWFAATGSWASQTGSWAADQ